MDKYGHLDPLLMSVAPETLPTCCPGYLIISLQWAKPENENGLHSDHFKIVHIGPSLPTAGPLKNGSGPQNGKIQSAPIFPGLVLFESSRHVFIHKFQGLALKMKIDEVMAILRFRLGPLGPSGPEWARWHIFWTNMAIWTPC